MVAMTPIARSKLLMYAYGITKDRGAAEFLLEDAIVSAARLTDMSKIIPGRLVGWIKIILRNKSLDWLRRWKRVRTYQELHHNVWTESALAVAISNEALVYFEGIVGKLPKVYQKVVMLKAVKKLTVDQIAKRLRIKRGTVMSRLHRAKHAMMEWLKRVEA